MRHPMMILVAVTGAYVLVCALAFVFQKHMVFFPDRGMFGTPIQAGMTYRDVFFDTEDGVRLHGWLVPAPEARRTVLFFHGNAGNISHRLESIQIFRNLGLSVFIFDYRGYGRSGGRVSEAGTYLDARAAYRHIIEEEGVDPTDIVFFGRSLGGSVAVELATHHKPRAVILESCFPTLADVGQRAYRFLPVRQLLRIRYDSTERIVGLACPKLIVHSRNDEIVPFDLGQRLFELASEPKEFLEIRGDHNAGFIESGRLYTDGLGRFLESLD
ncbi:MAG: alpha/beta hydrolase [Candidatus Latescibacterota bacterium]|nr:MAG: alpha/beta hydrolase [Candidatus Latescibacterota bacterium]